MYSFIAYVDESGDDGLKNFRAMGASGGASHFLTISACVMEFADHLKAVSWRDEIKEGTGKKTAGRSIHFADFNHEQKKFACQRLAQHPISYISATFYKPVAQEGSFLEKNTLYHYVTRHVIERISWFCHNRRRGVKEGDGRVEIIFSRRGGMQYGDFRNYLTTLKRSSRTTSIRWPVIDIDGIRAEDHSRVAGLQLADCGATAIARALEPDKFGNVERQYLEILKDRIYSHGGNFLSYGFKLLPRKEDIPFSPEQRKTILMMER